MSIVVRLQGGLGNQLFEYAAALYFGKKYGNVEIVREEAKNTVRYGHPRHCMIEDYNISAPIRDRTAWDRLICSHAWYKQPLAAAARVLSRTELYREHFSVVWTFLPALPFAPRTKNAYIEGFYQAYPYAEAVADQIRKEFTLRTEPSPANRATLDQIASCENPVSLHIRLGDYRLLYRGRDVLPLTYFKNAIEHIKQHVSNPTFFVFSDEIPYARESFAEYEGMIFVENNDEYSAPEDLRLMSACRHHIIANSTFSWWGAWLNPNADKVVCAPDVWRDPKVPYPDLLPPSWHRIKSEIVLNYDELPRFPPEYADRQT